MQRIDKTTQFSTKYKEWLDDLESKGENHPKYTSSDFRFYNDIKFDLLRCQKGLCAYTEMRLCSKEFLNDERWENEKYKFEKGITEANGQLEHFDPSLKKEKAWLWDNLFMIDADANNKKGDKPIDDILKPDKVDYDPLELMEFDLEYMVYIPNSKKTLVEQDRIEKMIDLLGINFPGRVKTERQRFYSRLKKEIEFEMFEEKDYIDSEFPTLVRIVKAQFIDQSTPEI